MASPTSTSPATVLPVATTTPGVLLKMDTRGRVQTSPQRRQAILAEFDRSGVSASQFAQLAGLRYLIFAGWISRHRRAKSGSRKPPLAGAAARPVAAGQL